MSAHIFSKLNLFVLLGCLCRRKVNEVQNKKNDVLEKKVFSFSIVDSIYIGLSTGETIFNIESLC